MRGVRDNSVREQGVSIFKGVRYAAPLTAQERFRAPRKLQSWTGVRDALAYGAPAIQPPPGNTPGVLPAEDCLFLNLWTPATKPDGKKRAVMYYLHGGGFVIGSGNARYQDGANLARNHDVVVIETNHRLGIMGYLWLGDVLGADYATSGNQSLFDITEGLDWVRRNAEAFGGDPNNVMVWGESGGGAKTSSIYGFTPATRLFHKASIESGPGIRMTTRDQAAATTRYVLDRLGIAPSEARKILDVPASALLAIQGSGGAGGPPQAVSAAEAAAEAAARARAMAGMADANKGRPPGGDGPGLKGMGAGAINSYASVIDGTYLPAHPFDPSAPAISANKPLLVGGNKDEATFFLRTSPDRLVIDKLDQVGLRERLVTQYGEQYGPALLAAYQQDMPTATPSQIAVAVSSDSFSRVGSTWIAEKKVAQGKAAVYNYRLVQGTTPPLPGTSIPGGAGHALDIGLKFDITGPDAAEPDNGAALIATAKNMSRYWTSFAKTGVPHAEGQPIWPAYDLNRRPMMLLKAKCEVVDDQYPNVRKVWAGMMSRST